MLVVRKSRIKNAGRGLFTTSRIRKGDQVVEYIGQKLTWKQCLKKYKGKLEKLTYVFAVNDDNCIDAYLYPEALASFANDANGTVGKKKYHNNCEYRVRKHRPYIIATKNIPPNTEILVDYGDEYWEAIREREEEAHEKELKRTGKWKEELKRREAEELKKKEAAKRKRAAAKKKKKGASKKKAAKKK